MVKQRRETIQARRNMTHIHIKIETNTKVKNNGDRTKEQGELKWSKREDSSRLFKDTHRIVHFPIRY